MPSSGKDVSRCGWPFCFGLSTYAIEYSKVSDGVVGRMECRKTS